METSKAEKLMRLHNDGLIVLVNDVEHAQSEVTAIYKKDGDILYDTGRCTGRSLSELWEGDVMVCKNITDWDIEVNSGN